MPEPLLADYLDRATLARELGCHQRTIARYENQPDGLPASLIAGRKYYRRAAVLEWLGSRERRPNPTRLAAKRGGA
jgi:hypothetical protein